MTLMFKENVIFYVVVTDVYSNYVIPYLYMNLPEDF